jgi:hypothetical protein
MVLYKRKHFEGHDNLALKKSLLWIICYCRRSYGRPMDNIRFNLYHYQIFIRIVKMHPNRTKAVFPFIFLIGINKKKPSTRENRDEWMNCKDKIICIYYNTAKVL